MLAANGLIGFVPTVDTVRAKLFYGDTLGLTFVGDDGFALTFAAHGSSVRIVKLSAFSPASFTILGWEVSDVSSEVRQLQAAGVVFERYSWAGPGEDDLPIWTAPDGSKVAWFKDPDGNVLSVSQHPYRVGQPV